MIKNPSYLQWLLEKRDNEHAYFSNFVHHFNLSNQVSATATYTSLIESTTIPEARRKTLRAAFEDFQNNHEEQFWINRNANIKVQKTAKLASGIIQDAGLKQAQLSFDQYFENETSNPTDQAIVVDTNDDKQLSLPVSSSTTPVEAISATDVNNGDDEGDDTEPEIDHALHQPFFCLVKYIFEKADGKSAELPPRRSQYASINHQQLYDYAYDLLTSGSATDPKGKKALVAVSGIINTVQGAPPGIDLAATIKKESLHPLLDVPIHELHELQLSLLRTMGPAEESPDIDNLRLEVFSRLADIGKARKQGRT
ncbi:hypothetical protein BGX21_005603, partial [Mortierella sp. AD011]